MTDTKSKSARKAKLPLPRLPKTFKTAIDAEVFRQQFDVPAKVRAALEQLDGKVIADNDFRVELGVSAQNWCAVRPKEEFAKNQLKVKDKIYWGQPAVLEGIRKTMDIL